ncbi:MAG: hypothetical protein EP146_03320 [Oscillibacter sp.]|uniref:hypothetical protein n=1 Tax=Oscillibacter sp. TaxID=1945593 RepID=UPI0013245D3C|nr:hypothetical protein [Oscillibacter sp.]MUU10459.1 hypothetical protein [Oscillibacter sp.]
MVGTDVSLPDFRARLFDWSREPDQVKQRDLLLELGSWENRISTEERWWRIFYAAPRCGMKKPLLLVQKELTAIALQEQEVIAAFVRMALSKLKGRSERLAIADEVLRLVAEEEGKRSRPCCIPQRLPAAV